MDLPSPVAAVPAASSEVALAHFAALLELETDCWDVHEALEKGQADFVLLDVRSPDLYAAGHVPGAVNLPHRRIVHRNLEAHPPETLFVVYCAGPHCNGADRAALRLARLGRAVKKMIGGIEGWKDEGFEARRKVRNMFSGAASRARHAAAAAGERTRDAATRAQQQLTDGSRRAMTQVERWVEENPLGAGAAALLAGFLIGMAVPERQRERRLLSGARRRLIQSAQRAGRDAVGRARQTLVEAANDRRRA